jgi:hypothetical protein
LCTSSNPPGASACEKCGTPFSNGRVAGAARSNLALYVAIGVAVVLALALIVVLMKK